jgi:hypothetical protein
MQSDNSTTTTRNTGIKNSKITSEEEYTTKINAMRKSHTISELRTPLYIEEFGHTVGWKKKIHLLLLKQK